ncbi:MAG: DeoR/GlpR transcriptional regulator [Alcaligenaceae bacterium]|nr:DeoR/GlpR transcriptional regulator [Alcaligenaceae bacterium]
MDTTTIIRKQNDSQSLLIDQRLARILERINTQGFQPIGDLANYFQVSPQTIRRDVNLLAERGQCRRSHGGVWPVSKSRNIDYPARRMLDLEAKKQIAHQVAGIIPEGASLFLGIGTTVEMCAVALSKHARLRVMTNNLNAATALARNESCEIIIAGGRLRNTDLDIISAEAYGFFVRFSVDIGIYGTGGINAEGDLLDFHEEEVRIRTDLTNHCSQRVLVLDHSKFGRGATVRAGHITDADYVFTDKPPPATIVDMLDAAGVKLVITPPHSTTNPLKEN